MSDTIMVNIRQSKSGYEGAVQLPGLQSTKLTRKDGSTTFPNTSAVKTVARSVGKRLGLEVSYNESTKKLATKKVKPTKTSCKATKATKTQSPSSPSNPTS